MYIRKVSQINKETGKEYYTHRIVETYRNADGKVRQRVLLNLGTHFAVAQKHWKELADRIEEIIRGQQTLVLPEEYIEVEAQSIAKRVIHRVADEAQPAKVVNKEVGDFYTVDINSLKQQQIREVGAEHVCNETIKQLHLPQLLHEFGFNRKQINVAIGSIVGRLLSPGSERATYKHLQTQSALDELLECDFQQLKLDDLYSIADRILRNKKTLEEKLFAQEKELFQLDEVITLYDLTNTYFEGRNLGNTKAAFGRSKEKRSDCKLVTLALALDSSGFPKKSEIYEGNISEPKTLKQVIQNFEGKIRPTIVMDAGIASAENIDWLKQNGYTYIVMSKKKDLLIPDENSRVLQHKKDYLIQATLVKNEETAENELYCYSALKEEKERSMHDQAFSRYETGLKQIADGLKKKRTSKKYAKILEHLGRLKEKYKSVSYTYAVEIVTDESNKNVVDIKWTRSEEKQKPLGVYCLRSNCDDLDEQVLWDTYIMLTELEAAFRCLKSELGLRPIYHQITHRVDSHIFISLLAYHVLHTIRYQLKQHGIDDSWVTIRKDLRTHCRVTSTMICKDGRKLHIRKSSQPNPRQLEIYRALKIASIPGKTEKSIF